MRLAHARPTNLHHVVRRFDELDMVQLADKCFFVLGLLESEVGQIPIRGKRKGRIWWALERTSR